MHPVGKSLKIVSKMCSVLVFPSTWDKKSLWFQGTFKKNTYFSKKTWAYKFKQIDPQNLKPWGSFLGRSSNDESRHSVVFPVPLRPKKTVTSPSLRNLLETVVELDGSGEKKNWLYMHFVR